MLLMSISSHVKIRVMSISSHVKIRVIMNYAIVKDFSFKRILSSIFKSSGSFIFFDRTMHLEKVLTDIAGAKSLVLNSSLMQSQTVHVPDTRHKNCFISIKK